MISISHIYTILEFTKLNSNVEFTEFHSQHRLPKLPQFPRLKCCTHTSTTSLRVYQKSSVTKKFHPVLKTQSVDEEIERGLTAWRFGKGLQGKECGNGERCFLGSNAAHLEIDGIFPMTFPCSQLPLGRCLGRTVPPEPLRLASTGPHT